MPNAIFWFEIPAADIERARKFYSAIFDQEFKQIEVNEGYPMFTLGSMGGAVVQGKEYTPSDSGVVLYLDVGDPFDDILAWVKPAGGQIVMSKTDMGGHGFSAYILDSEGNKIGLASTK